MDAHKKTSNSFPSQKQIPCFEGDKSTYPVSDIELYAS